MGTNAVNRIGVFTNFATSTSAAHFNKARVNAFLETFGAIPCADMKIATPMTSPAKATILRVYLDVKDLIPQMNVKNFTNGRMIKPHL